MSNQDCGRGSERRKGPGVGVTHDPRNADVGGPKRGVLEVTNMRGRTLAAGALAAALLSYGAAGQTKAGEVITSFDQPNVGIGMICNTADQAQHSTCAREGQG
jgi:hypothetical protein